MRKEFFYESCGAGEIHGCCWMPDCNPKGVLQIIHGIADHILRYDDFANYMANYGYIVVGEDHMGHGKSRGEHTSRGYFNGGWFSAVKDSYQLMNTMRLQYPNVPYILFGHSMGSYMALTILQKYPVEFLSGCILCGSGWQPQPAVSTLTRLSDTACRMTGDKAVSHKLQHVLLSAYNIKVEHHRTPFDWTNRKTKSVDEFLSDPLCDVSITAGLIRDLLKGISFVQEENNLKNLPDKTPFLLVSGGDDPVGLYGDGVHMLSSKLQLAGLRVKTKIYPLLRHEILNEFNNSEVYVDIRNWVEEQLD